MSVLKEISILIGGKAGDGIKGAGQIIARLLNRLGYRIFLYDEYPSLVKGGHNFNVIRGSEKKIRLRLRGPSDAGGAGS